MEENVKNSFKVGILALLSISAIIFSLFILEECDYGTKKKLNLVIQFNYLDGLEIKSPVRISGGEKVGIVKRFEYTNSSIYTHISLDEKMKNFIPKNKNTVFSIFSTTLLGGRYVNITLGNYEENQKYYQNEDFIVGRDPVSLDLILLSMSTWLGDEKGGQTIAEILSSVKYFIENLNNILDDNKTNITAVVKNLRSSFASVSLQIQGLMENLNSISTDALFLSQKHKEEIGILIQSITTISYDISSILQRMNEGRGSVGRVLVEDGLYEEAYSTIKNARDLMKILKEKPWLLLYRE